MKNISKVVFVILVMAVVIVGAVLLYKSVGPREIELKPGWQLIQVDGKVPKGAIVIVENESGAVLPDEYPETKRATGYISQGRITFYETLWMATEQPVWVYYPDKYEFILKQPDFSQQALDKLSSLTGKTETKMNEYSVGHP